MKTVIVVALALAIGQNPTFDAGIRINQKIPSFRLIDQNGATRDYNSIKGSKGAVLLFFRSADW